MTLDREAARALFDNAETTPPSAPPIAATPRFASTRTDPPAYEPVEDAPFIAGPGVLERTNSPRARKGVDWRIVAPLGVAALCAGAVALFAIPRNDAVDGKTVAATDITAPPAAEPLSPPPADLATADNTDTVGPAATTAPAPVVKRAATRPTPVAVRRAPARQVAAAPSATDSASNVSAREPYVPTPTLGTPATVTLTPATPPASVEPVIAAPPPITQPEPEPQL